MMRIHDRNRIESFLSSLSPTHNRTSSEKFCRFFLGRSLHRNPQALPKCDAQEDRDVRKSEMKEKEGKRRKEKERKNEERLKNGRLEIGDEKMRNQRMGEKKIPKKVFQDEENGPGTADGVLRICCRCPSLRLQSL